MCISCYAHVLRKSISFTKILLCIYFTHQIDLALTDSGGFPRRRSLVKATTWLNKCLALTLDSIVDFMRLEDAARSDLLKIKVSYQG